MGWAVAAVALVVAPAVTAESLVTAAPVVTAESLVNAAPVVTAAPALNVAPAVDDADAVVEAVSAFASTAFSLPLSTLFCV